MARNFLLLVLMITGTLTVNAQIVSWGHNLSLPNNHFISALATTPAGESITSINNQSF